METGIFRSQSLVILVIELEWIASCFNNYPLPLHHQFMHSLPIVMSGEIISPKRRLIARVIDKRNSEVDKFIWNPVHCNGRALHSKPITQEVITTTMAPRGRPRGSGRGGAKAPERQAQKAAESELSAPPAENSEAVPDAAFAADPKQGKESLNADHDMPDAQLQASAEQTDQPPATSASASASASASTSTRPAVQRLDSLKGISAPDPRSASPATRGAAAARGRKPLSRQPVFKGRRSKEERDALQQEALERERERRAEREAEIRKTNRGLYRGAGGRGRGDRAGRGRGGYMGDVPVSGPFSLGKVTNGMFAW